MPRFPSAQGRLNHEPDSTLAVTKTCPKDGVHLCHPLFLFVQVVGRQQLLIFPSLRIGVSDAFE